MAKSKMNLPNKLTVMRMFMVPVCIAAILIPEAWLDPDLTAIIALVIFSAASIPLAFMAVHTSIRTRSTCRVVHHTSANRALSTDCTS